MSTKLTIEKVYRFCLTLIIDVADQQAPDVMYCSFGSTRLILSTPCKVTSIKVTPINCSILLPALLWIWWENGRELYLSPARCLAGARFQKVKATTDPLPHMTSRETAQDDFNGSKHDI